MNPKDKYPMPKSADMADVMISSAPVARDLVNHTYENCHHLEPVNAIALMGAAVAITKHAGYVSKEEFISVCSQMWYTQETIFADEVRGTA